MSEAHGVTTRRRSRSRSKGRSTLDTKPIRVWCPGSYDTLHWGYISFLRKVKQQMMANFPKVEVVVGLYSDKSLIDIGEQPIFSLNERYEMIRANKWVDDIVQGAPFEISKEVLERNNCDYACCSTLEDKYSQQWSGCDEKLTHELRECGLLKIVAPSKNEYSGISASQIVNRLLLLEDRDENNNTISGKDWAPKKVTFPDSISCKELIRFGTGQIPKASDKIVYVDGSFDLLHPGHLRLLEKARGLGDFLYVGLHSDDAISKYTGNSNFPIMQWNERLMALLSCKYVSEVVIDAPVGTDKSILDAFGVNVVVPSIDDYFNNDNDEKEDRHKVAKQRGIFHEIVDDLPAQTKKLTTVGILNRVHQNWNEYSSAVNKLSYDVASDLDEVNVSLNRDDGDVLKFSSSDSNSVH